MLDADLFPILYSTLGQSRCFVPICDYHPREACDGSNRCCKTKLYSLAGGSTHQLALFSVLLLVAGDDALGA